MPVQRFFADRQVPLQTDWTMGIDARNVIRLEHIYEDVTRVLPGADTAKIRKIHEDNIRYANSPVRRAEKKKVVWTRRMRDIVNDYFHRDFEFYGYEKI